MENNKILQYCREHYPQESISKIAIDLKIDRHKLSNLMKEAGIEIRKMVGNIFSMKITLKVQIRKRKLIGQDFWRPMAE